jgi:serine protease
VKKGVVIVAAAGTRGRSVGWPAAYPGVIAVSATDSNDKIAWFSSRGPEIAIAAPGVNVTQQTVCENGQNKCEIFGTFNGTSMASPHVAGAAALLVGQGVTDADAVKAALQKTALKKDGKELYGAGRLDVGAAASHVHWNHFLLRAGALLALFALIASRIKRCGGTVAKTPGALVGALIAGVGLIPFAPLLHLNTLAGPFRWITELLMRPLGEWDLVYSVALHRFLPLANAIPAIVLTGLFFGTKRLRFTVGGFALGSAAFLAQMAISADVASFGGTTLMRLWTVANAIVCLWIARVSLDRKSA